ncbi:MAG: ATP synthase F0 subunit C [Clostridiales bacterium]
MKRIWSLFAVLALLCALTIPALAAAGGEQNVETPETLSEVEESAEAGANENTVKLRKIWAVAALIGVACFGGALGMAHSVAKAANNMAEQPEAAGQIRTSMMMGLVFIETVIIYALIIAILIIFVL